MFKVHNHVYIYAILLCNCVNSVVGWKQFHQSVCSRLYIYCESVSSEMILASRHISLSIKKKYIYMYLSVSGFIAGYT